MTIVVIDVIGFKRIVIKLLYEQLAKCGAELENKL